MKRSILVTGGDTFLGALLVRRLSELGHQTITTRQPVQDKKRGRQDPSYIDWMRGSALSAKNVLMEARGTLPQLDTVYIVVSPLNIQNTLEATPPLSLEQHWDDWTKGVTFLVREAVKEARNAALELRFIFYLEESSDVHPVTAMVYEGLAVFAKSLMKSQSGSGLVVSAFECRNGDGQNFVETIAAQTSAVHGEWKTFPEKTSLFGKIQRRSIA